MSERTQTVGDSFGWFGSEQLAARTEFLQVINFIRKESESVGKAVDSHLDYYFA